MGFSPPGRGLSARVLIEAVTETAGRGTGSARKDKCQETADQSANFGVDQHEG
jgi:hypothetical protein